MVNIMVFTDSAGGRAFADTETGMIVLISKGLEVAARGRLHGAAVTAMPHAVTV